MDSSPQSRQSAGPDTINRRERSDRRARADRRKLDLGPPAGVPDRRTGVDRRSGRDRRDG